MIALKKGRRVSGNQMLASISTWPQARILQRIKRVFGRQTELSLGDAFGRSEAPRFPRASCESVMCALKGSGRSVPRTSAKCRA